MKTLVLGLGCGVLLLAGCTRLAGPVPPPALLAADAVRPDGLPEIGKWMLAPDGWPARWLGATWEGKHLHEPVNVIFVDRAATSPGEATNRLLRALALAGFAVRLGHSSGYSAFIGGQRYEQFPATHATAISDEPFEVNNNHGRLFGPCLFNGVYVCTAAFSRERVAPLEQVKHAYESFNRARDAVAQNLDRKTAFKLAAFVPLQNHLLGRPDVTTGDHDGVAVLLAAHE